MDESCSKPAVGGWKFLRILGSGGFGQVSLWYDSFTGQKIALKKLLETTVKDETVKCKLTERWCNEVEIMKKLDHPNIVGTLDIPEELKMMEPFPVLAMEYCCCGDLRKVLSKGENCSGLQETNILNILRDISNGLAYLHSCKIIHRDIKPDNIVLQQKDKATVYKLIDLGYAKSLDQSSLSRSFVGTIQYIAPELFLGKEYTSSVDYWSFGLTAHEIITGYRPFLHGFRPSEWMKQIQGKPKDVICVVEAPNGEINFCPEISRRNHLTRCFLNDIEKWLRLALDWNGQIRGRDEKNRLVIFESLTDILCKKFIKVFSLSNYDIFAYEVTPQTDISDLRRWLEKDTGLEEDDQLLLLPDGKSVNSNGNLLKNIDSERLERSAISLFLFSSSSVITSTHRVSIPNFLTEFHNVSEKDFSYRQLKRFCAESVYFLQYLAIRYRNFLRGIKMKITHTKQKTQVIESFYDELEDEWNRIENYASFLSFSHKTDLESYIYYRKAGKLKTSPFVRKWIENAININSKLSELKNTFNKTKQRELVLLAKKRCQILEDHSNYDAIRSTPLDALVEKGENLWENLQKSSLKSDADIPGIIATVNKMTEKGAEEVNKFLSSKTLKTLFVKISEADGNLSKFYSHLRNIYKSMNILKLMIEQVQTERQKEIWSMVESSRLPKDESDLPSIVPNGDDDWKESNGKEASDPDLKSIPSEISLPDSYSARSVIEDNNRLRYRIQEAQQACNEMCTEICSLKWDLT